MIRIFRNSAELSQLVLINIWTIFATVFSVFCALGYRDPAAIMIFGTCALVGWYGVFRGISGLITPYNTILEITDTGIRFGREDKPEDMTVIVRENVRGIRIDFEDRELLADTGRPWLQPCTSGGFLTIENLNEIRQYLCDNWNSTPVS